MIEREESDIRLQSVIDPASQELLALLRERIAQALAGAVSDKSVEDILAEELAAT